MSIVRLSRMSSKTPHQSPSTSQALLGMASQARRANASHAACFRPGSNRRANDGGLSGRFQLLPGWALIALS